ncbi:MAG TPA: tetratricopeptide repeat protein [Candidatus Eisenbacteria bacterium]
MLSAAVLPYLPTIRYDFVWDDKVVVGPHLDIRGPADIARLWGTPYDTFLRDPVLQRTYFRPLVLYSLSVDRALFGERAGGYHAMNVAWYAAGCLFLWLFAWEISGRPVAATAGGVLFALHPTHPESAAFISGRTDLLAAAFLFAALWAAARLGPRIRPAWRSLLPASLLLLPGLFAKEVALFGAPLLLLALWIADRRRGPADVARAAVPVAAACAVYLACRMAVLGPHPLPVVTPVEGTLPQLLTSVSVAAQYVPLLLLPVRLSARHEILEIHSPLHPQFLAGVIVIAAILAALAWSLSRRSAWALPVSIFAATLLPLCWVRILSGAIVAERFLFVPSAALAPAVALLPVSLPVLLAGGAAAAVTLWVLLLPRVSIWRDEGTLFASMLRESPQSPYVHAILGGYYYQKRNLPLAAYHHRRTYELQPKFTESLLNLGAVQDEMGETDSAFVTVRLLIDLRGDYAPAWYALGNLYVRVDNPDSARWAYERAIGLEPDFPEAENNLGAVLERMGRAEEALAHYRRALARKPGYREAENNFTRLSAELKARP